MPLRDQWPKCRQPGNLAPHYDRQWLHLPQMRSAPFVRMWETVFLRPGERQPRGAHRANKRDWSIERINQFWVGMLEGTREMFKKNYVPSVGGAMPLAYHNAVLAEMRCIAKIHFPTWQMNVDDVNHLTPGSEFSEPWKVPVR